MFGLLAFRKVMQSISIKRLWWGGLLGPLSAFLYCIGFYGVYLTTISQYKILALAVFFLWSLSLFVGGAYHMQFTAYGILARSEDEEVIDTLGNSILSYAKVYLLPFLIGQIILAGLTLFGKTIYPAWYIVFSPALLLVFSLVWNKLPQPYKNILAGGWNNLVFSIYFLSSLAFVLSM